MEQDSNDFAMDIKICKKSAFMLLSFQDRVIKLRNYFKKEEYPFLGMSKEEKRQKTYKTVLALMKTTISQYSRKRGLHEVSKQICLVYVSVLYEMYIYLQTGVIISYRLFLCLSNGTELQTVDL